MLTMRRAKVTWRKINRVKRDLVTSQKNSVVEEGKKRKEKAKLEWNGTE